MRVFKKKILSRNHQPWKNKKRRRQERSKDDDKSQPNHLPLDLALDIVSRLPAKSIMRYQCVSKLWSSFITLPSFTNSFTSRSTSRSPTLLITFASGSEKYVFSFPQDQVPDRSTCSPFYSYQITNTDWKYPRSESIRGLILSPDFKIWNPTLNRFLSLPRPDKSSSSRDGWGSCLDAHGHKWTRELFVLHLPYESVQKFSIHFWGTTDAGEFVFAPSDFYETFYALYLDPKRNSTRKVFLERNMGDLRRRCGLDSINGKSTLQVFPNHIESLFS
ncbi:unnamed protein product [Eruca vesicaria subsp. sativa]|uniref:F-box domain-containing protein n=1 Tax=Eruca vesicaria subsp. sativa TaxID=29727 RepID=A0ABC8K940_ERUVS|nr:unnamed protein product [Eruca vesicaria subsp. sativa]